MDAAQGNGMAEEESILASPPTPEDARHVRDYSRFITLLKWGAIVCFLIAMIVILFIL